MPYTLRYARQATHVTHDALNKSKRNDAVSKRNVKYVKHVIRVAEFEILNPKSDSFKPRSIFSISSIRSRDIAPEILAIPLILRYS